MWGSGMKALEFRGLSQVSLYEAFSGRGASLVDDLGPRVFRMVHEAL